MPYKHSCSALNDVLVLLASYKKKPLFVECITGGVHLKSRVSGPTTECDAECQCDINHIFDLSDNGQIDVLFDDESDQ